MIGFTPVWPGPWFYWFGGWVGWFLWFDAAAVCDGGGVLPGLRFSGFLLESLILAQDERWRRA